MLIPPELARHLPRVEQELVNRRQMIGPGIVLYGISLFMFSRHPNVWVRVVPFLFGPPVAGLFLTVRPYNPYKSLFASIAGITPETVKDDPAAQRLLALLRSSGARHTIWTTAIGTSITFLLLAWIGSTLAGRATSWEFPYFALSMAVLLQGAMSLGVFYHRLLRWAIRAWQAETRG
jgi:hypothetical protein